VTILQLLNFFIFILTLGHFQCSSAAWSRSIPEFEQASSTDKGLFTLFAFAQLSVVYRDFDRTHSHDARHVDGRNGFPSGRNGIRVSRPRRDWKHFAALGALLGLGIYVKAALFPLAFAFIALLFLSLARTSEIPRKRLLAFLAMTTGMCAVVAAPLDRLDERARGKTLHGRIPGA